MDFRILGPLEVRDDGATLPLGGGKQRALLALLLLHPNEAVSTDRLIDELWGEQPPPTAGKILQNHVSQLRRVLSDGLLVTRGRGYALRVAAGELDLDRFRQGLEEGRRAQAAGSPERASAVLREALELWRGPPLGEFAFEPFAQEEIDRLEELHLTALIERIDADLALGRHADLVGELESLVARHPLQERLRGQLMLALYRSGRQAEALQVYQDARRTLVEELGIEPGQSLQGLEKAILVHDPSLEPPVRRHTAVLGTVKARARPRRLLVAGALLVVGAATAAWILLPDGGSRPIDAVPLNAVGSIDPKTNKLVGYVPNVNYPLKIAAGGGSVWTLDSGSQTVSKIDPKTMRIDWSFNVGLSPSGWLSSIAYAGGSVWAVRGIDETVIRIAGAGFFLSRYERTGTRDIPDMAVGQGAVWVMSFTRRKVIKLDLVTLRPVAAIPVHAVPAAIAVGDGEVWFTAIDDTSKAGFVARIDPVRERISSMVRLPGIPNSLAIGYGAVWATVNSANQLWRIDPRTSSVTRTIQVGAGPVAVAVGANAVWVVNARDGTVSRIDPAANRVVATIRVGGSPRDVAVGSGRVWVAVL